MSATGNNIFLLEAIVRRVMLTDPTEASSTCPLCVCFRFPGLVDMEVCEGDLCDNIAGGGRPPVGAEVRMTRGKSCLFAVATADLCAAARDFQAVIAVYRRVAGGPETRLVAQTPRLHFGRAFTDVICEPNQDDRTRQLKRALALYENDRPNSVGVVEVIVRLTSHGDLLVTQFVWNVDSNKYQYKGVDEFVPTDVKDCQDDGRRNRRRCRRRGRKTNKTCYNNDRPTCCVETASLEDVNCDKHMKRVNCVLSAMELMKELFTKSVFPLTAKRSDGGDKQMANDGVNSCALDPDCPVVGCPFRLIEPPNAFVDRLISGGRQHPCTVNSLARPAADSAGEIVDDADLFAILVGRVDPCRTNAPVYRNKFTQYLEEDIFGQYPPVSQPPMSVKNKLKKKKKSKKKKL